MRLALAAFLFSIAVHAADPPAAPRWRVQYFYDKDDTAFTINDLAFSSPQRGIAVGAVEHRRGRGRPTPMSVITRDGGLHWTEVPLPEIPVSLFLLNDNVGWMVTVKGLWRTDEAGRFWKKVKGFTGLLRVYFRDEMRGWVTGASKLFKETRDGGKTWTDVAAARELSTAADNTYFDWIEWASPTHAIVLGGHVAPRRDFIGGSWMDPEKLSRRREWPGLNITLETGDGGNTWAAFTAPTFGRFTRFRMSKEQVKALSLVRFFNTLRAGSDTYGSEVYLVDIGGKSTRVFRDPLRNVTDVLWRGKQAYLVAVEPAGKLHQLPVPGKLHVLVTDNTTVWREMKVDYRAFAGSAIFATAGADVWIATDTGQILKLM